MAPIRAGTSRNPAPADGVCGTVCDPRDGPSVIKVTVACRLAGRLECRVTNGSQRIRSHVLGETRHSIEVFDRLGILLPSLLLKAFVSSPFYLYPSFHVSDLWGLRCVRDEVFVGDVSPVTTAHTRCRDLTGSQRRETAMREPLS